jgi:hypothetical protein
LGIDDPADSWEPVPGSDEWWNKVLTAFKAYTGLGAVGTLPEQQKTTARKRQE